MTRKKKEPITDDRAMDALDELAYATMAELGFSCSL